MILELVFTYNFVGNLDTDSIFTQTSLSLVDTVTNTKADMKIPARFTGGISFALDEAYNFYFDFLFQPMSKYSFNSQPDVEFERCNSKYSLRISNSDLENMVGMTTMEQIMWRFGLSYEQTQYVL